MSSQARNPPNPGRNDTSTNPQQFETLGDIVKAARGNASSTPIITRMSSTLFGNLVPARDKNTGEPLSGTLNQNGHFILSGVPMDIGPTTGQSSSSSPRFPPQQRPRAQPARRFTSSAHVVQAKAFPVSFHRAPSANPSSSSAESSSSKEPVFRVPAVPPPRPVQTFLQPKPTGEPPKPVPPGAKTYGAAHPGSCTNRKNRGETVQRPRPDNLNHPHSKKRNTNDKPSEESKANGDSRAPSSSGTSSNKTLSATSSETVDLLPYASGLSDEGATTSGYDSRLGYNAVITKLLNMDETTPLTTDSLSNEARAVNRKFKEDYAKGMFPPIPNTRENSIHNIEAVAHLAADYNVPRFDEKVSETTTDKIALLLNKAKDEMAGESKSPSIDAEENSIEAPQDTPSSSLSTSRNSRSKKNRVIASDSTPSHLKSSSNVRLLVANHDYNPSNVKTEIEDIEMPQVDNVDADIKPSRAALDAMEGEPKKKKGRMSEAAMLMAMDFGPKEGGCLANIEIGHDRRRRTIQPHYPGEPSPVETKKIKDDEDEVVMDDDDEDYEPPSSNTPSSSNHVSTRKRALEEVTRVTRASNRIALSSPTPATPSPARVTRSSLAADSVPAVQTAEKPKPDAKATSSPAKKAPSSSTPQKPLPARSPSEVPVAVAVYPAAAAPEAEKPAVATPKAKTPTVAAAKAKTPTVAAPSGESPAPIDAAQLMNLPVKTVVEAALLGQYEGGVLSEKRAAVVAAVAAANKKASKASAPASSSGPPDDPSEEATSPADPVPQRSPIGVIRIERPLRLRTSTPQQRPSMTGQPPTRRVIPMHFSDDDDDDSDDSDDSNDSSTVDSDDTDGEEQAVQPSVSAAAKSSATPQSVVQEAVQKKPEEPQPEVQKSPAKQPAAQKANVKKPVLSPEKKPQLIEPVAEQPAVEQPASVAQAEQPRPAHEPMEQSEAEPVCEEPPPEEPAPAQAAQPQEGQGRLIRADLMTPLMKLCSTMTPTPTPAGADFHTAQIFQCRNQLPTLVANQMQAEIQNQLVSQRPIVQMETGPALSNPSYSGGKRIQATMFSIPVSNQPSTSEPGASALATQSIVRSSPAVSEPPELNRDYDIDDGNESTRSPHDDTPPPELEAEEPMQEEMVEQPPAPVRYNPAQLLQQQLMQQQSSRNFNQKSNRMGYFHNSRGTSNAKQELMADRTSSEGTSEEASSEEVVTRDRETPAERAARKRDAMLRNSLLETNRMNQSIAKDERKQIALLNFVNTAASRDGEDVEDMREVVAQCKANGDQVKREEELRRQRTTEYLNATGQQPANPPLRIPHRGVPIAPRRQSLSTVPAENHRIIVQPLFDRIQTERPSSSSSASSSSTRQDHNQPCSSNSPNPSFRTMVLQSGFKLKNLADSVDSSTVEEALRGVPNNHAVEPGHADSPIMIGDDEDSPRRRNRSSGESTSRPAVSSGPSPNQAAQDLTPEQRRLMNRLMGTSPPLPNSGSSAASSSSSSSNRQMPAGSVAAPNARAQIPQVFNRPALPLSKQHQHPDGVQPNPGVPRRAPRLPEAAGPSDSPAPAQRPGIPPRPVAPVLHVIAGAGIFVPPGRSMDFAQWTSDDVADWAAMFLRPNFELTDATLAEIRNNDVDGPILHQLIRFPEMRADFNFVSGMYHKLVSNAKALDNEFRQQSYRQALQQWHERYNANR